MADEPEVVEEEIEEEPVEQQPEQIEAHGDLVSTVGRLEKASKEAQAYKQFLEANGVQAVEQEDGTFQFARRDGYQQQMPEAPEPEPEVEPDPYDLINDPDALKKYVAQVADKTRQDTLAEVQKFIGPYVPVMEQAAVTGIAAKYSDWPEIGAGVQSRLRGYNLTVAQAYSQCPQWLEDLVFAERGRRVTTPQQPTETPEERTARLAQSQLSGGGTVPSGSGLKYEWPPDEKANILAFMKANNYTEDEVAELYGKPAVVKTGGDK